MPSSDPAQRFRDILENIIRVESYVAGRSESQFVGDSMRVDATERCLSRISEAAVKLGDAAARLAPEIPWRDIRGLGNILRHEYAVVDAMRIWRLIVKDLPPLKAACQLALKQLGSA
jgi:uncharacterized protein with HEPN domain